MHRHSGLCHKNTNCMKKFLLIAASAAFVLSATAAPAEVRFTNLGNKQLNEKRAATLARINRATDESKLV